MWVWHVPIPQLYKNHNSKKAASFPSLVIPKLPDYHTSLERQRASWHPEQSGTTSLQKKSEAKHYGNNKCPSQIACWKTKSLQVFPVISPPEQQQMQQPVGVLVESLDPRAYSVEAPGSQSESIQMIYSWIHEWYVHAIDLYQSNSITSCAQEGKPKLI